MELSVPAVHYVYSLQDYLIHREANNDCLDLNLITVTIVTKWSDLIGATKQ